ncbi:RDD family protein [Sulfurovum sp. zt1-1]|uniref:RDD family protein n=1 Tax=Sulfurovum zhangzhouensis TaxID=3019067 RepID=A0ABT7QWK1_9BACT|nr:RDD family protein [Sulfurovum zhangzhouensis]MDM5271215.1 RDD family protein [Sulfurovum zhangzhouensis]
MNEQNSLSIATPQKRVVSFVIDDIIVSLFFMVIFYDQITLFLQAIPVEDRSQSQVILDALNQFVSANILWLLALKVIYHTVLVWQNGMTLGKYIMKIKVVSLETQEKPVFMTALYRALLRIPSELVLYLGFLMAFFTPLTQTFHDKFSRCVVVDA